jgi:hypothetical protein
LRLTRKLLTQELLVVKLKSSLSTLYGHHLDMVNHYRMCVCVCVCACACACACACVCQRWLRICAICRSHHHALISSSMIYHTIWFLKMLLTCDLSRCWPFWLGSLVLLRHKWPRICSTCCKHFPVLSPFMIYHRVCN